MSPVKSLHKEIKTRKVSTDQLDSILQSETTKNSQSQLPCLLSWRWEPSMAPIRLSIPAGGSPPFCPGLSSSVFSVANLGILMLDVCGGWRLDQFRSPKGTCKLKQKSWLHCVGVPLLFCPPEVHCANSHDLFQLTLHFPGSNTSTSLLKLNWPFRNVLNFLHFNNLAWWP